MMVHSSPSPLVLGTARYGRWRNGFSKKFSRAKKILKSPPSAADRVCNGEKQSKESKRKEE